MIYQSSNVEVQKMDKSKLLRKAFIYAAWGAEKPENHSMIEEIKTQYQFLLKKESEQDDSSTFAGQLKQAFSAQTAINLEVLKMNQIDKLEAYLHLGQFADSLSHHYEKKLNQFGATEQVESWLAQEINQYGEIVDEEQLTHHLKKVKEKWKERSLQCQQRRNDKTEVNLKPILLNKNGIHPNSVRALPTCDYYEILIDESGSKFITDFELHNQPTKKEKGRMIAVVIPDHHKLPELPADFHAWNITNSKIQNYFQNALNAKLGVFGLELGDPSMRHCDSWFALTNALLRWTIAMLPIDPNKPTTVNVFIEQRAQYNTQIDLMSVRDLILNDLKNISKTHFANLSLNFNIITKDGHPNNGYADLVANLWGSPDSFRKKLLTASQVFPYCLLAPQRNSGKVERAYFELFKQVEMTNEHWYHNCYLTYHESDHSLLQEVLDELGKKAQKNPSHWQERLEYVKYLLAIKNYKLPELGAALNWLNQFKPEQKILPKLLELELITAELAVNNHQGLIVDHTSNKQKRLLELCAQLRDENAPLVTEALLRITVSATNAFDFDKYQSTIHSLIHDQVRAVPGLLNYGKLQSTLGQIHAFKGEQDQAIDWFNKAIKTFAALSDPDQKAKEQLQTQSYLLIAMMDSDEKNSDAFEVEFMDYLQKVTGIKSTDLKDHFAALSCSGNDVNVKYAHHIALRWLCYCYDGSSLVRTYFSQQEKWQDAQDHPWALIDAYRACLLLRKKDNEENRLNATILMSDAIEKCTSSHSGATLRWMVIALKQLKLDLQLTNEAQLQADIAQFKQDYPELKVPFEALEQSNLKPLERFATLLPFNFH